MGLEPGTPSPFNLSMKSIHTSVGLLFGVLLALFLVPVAGVSARETKPLLHGLFTDNMVLQRDVSIPVWGWAEPGKLVKVSFKGKSATAVADPSGKWMVHLPALPADANPSNLVVEGDQTITLSNVLLGDVWICSGQSNMEMGVGVSQDAEAEIKNADHPLIRLFTVPKKVAYRPEENLKSTWLVCDPTNLKAGVWGGFSAVGYYFGRELQKDIKVPVGLIHTSWGGTVAEAWTSAEGLKPLGDFQASLDQVAEIAQASNTHLDFNTMLAKWYAKNDSGTAAGWPAQVNTSDWKIMKLPQAWEGAGLPDYDGIVWFQKEVVLPESWAGKSLMLHLGPIDDCDTTWVNGIQVGAKNAFNEERNYAIPGALIQAGPITITVRVLDTGGAGGMFGKPEQMRLELLGNTSEKSISLAGDWHYKETASLAKTSPVPQAPGDNPNVTTVLYNGMIAPLIPFGVKGAIWYQGESNAGRAEQYRRLLPAMIEDWRQRFGVGQFPFFIVHLANFMAVRPEPADSAWAELREAQAFVSQTLPKTGLALAIDIGDAVDIHPKNKQEVGSRLAKAARAIAYHEDLEYSGPIYEKMAARGNGIQISFTHAKGGLKTQGGDKLQGFAIAGADGKFVWAEAVVEGSSVLVSSPKVEHPTAVRYAWADNPICNLYNQAGLPAVPFRTDRK